MRTALSFGCRAERSKDINIGKGSPTFRGRRSRSNKDYASPKPPRYPRGKAHGFFGKLLAGLKKPAGGAAWLLPTGGYAEQIGERQSGLLLVWFDEDSAKPDEARLQARWGGHTLRKAGPNLFVVSPGLAGSLGPTETPTLLGKPREQSEAFLAEARQAGSRPAEATALTDLGVTFMRGGDNNRALVILEEAYSFVRKLKDSARENDALIQLALATAAVGQPARGQELLGQALAFAKESDDRVEEKLILGHLGTVLAAMRNYGEAVTTIDHALALRAKSVTARTKRISCGSRRF